MKKTIVITAVTIGAIALLGGLSLLVRWLFSDYPRGLPVGAGAVVGFVFGWGNPASLLRSMSKELRGPAGKDDLPPIFQLIGAILLLPIILIAPLFCCGSIIAQIAGIEVERLGTTTNEETNALVRAAWIFYAGYFAVCLPMWILLYLVKLASGRDFRFSADDR